jgi:hypothetical protein
LRSGGLKLSKVRFDDFLPSWCIRRAPAWDNRSTRGVRRENLSKSGALERIGIALAGIVGHRQTVNKGFSDIRNFSFAEFASGGFPNILQRVSESAAK